MGVAVWRLLFCVVFLARPFLLQLRGREAFVYAPISIGLALLRCPLVGDVEQGHLFILGLAPLLGGRCLCECALEVFDLVLQF